MMSLSTISTSFQTGLPQLWRHLPSSRLTHFALSGYADLPALDWPAADEGTVFGRLETVELSGNGAMVVDGERVAGSCPGEWRCLGGGLMRSMSIGCTEY